MKHTILRALSCLAVLCLLGTGTFAIAEDAPGSRILVAYYSYTGNTEAIARQIAQLTGGDLARIERTTPLPAGQRRLSGSGRTGNPAWRNA